MFGKAVLMSKLNQARLENEAWLKTRNEDYNVYFSRSSIVSLFITTAFLLKIALLFFTIKSECITPVVMVLSLKN
jgi:hypothetical protein